LVFHLLFSLKGLVMRNDNQKQPIIVTVAQQKGGAGKTTMALQLAVAWQKQGHKVALIDIDPQGSANAWSHVRAKALAEKYEGPEVVSITGWRMVGELSRLQQYGFDIIIVDSPPRAEAEVCIAVRSSDICVIPLQASPMDVWATKPTLQFCFREKVPALLVMNRINMRTKLASKMIEEAQLLGAEVSEQTIGSRVAFQSSLAEGMGVVETEPYSDAAKEIDALAAEVLKRAKAKSKKSAFSKAA
jgi:chromosome partitioning protein